MSLPRYPEYKEWDAERAPLPSHWDAVRLIRAASLNDDVLSEATDPAFAMEYVDIGSVSLDRGIEQTQQFTFAAAPSRARRLVRDGDILVSTVRTYLKAIAPIVSPPDNLVASTGFAVVRPSPRLHPGFAKYALQSTTFVDEVISRSTGVSYPAINASDLARIRLPMPPGEEQSAIAAFLDRETAKIDALIAEQERLIALLAEKRQATISHAVTKGLNPDAPMKDSGVPWLGEVPAHWRLVRVKHIVQRESGIQMGPFGGMLLDLDTADTGFKVYGQENTISGDFSRGARWISGDRFHELSRYQLLAGDLVLTRKGSIGNARLIDELPQPGICDSDTIRVRVDRGQISPEILAVLLHEAPYVTEQLVFSKRGAILAGLNSETVANLVLVVPPLDEQARVLAFIEQRMGAFDETIEFVQCSKRLLGERRSALIAAAVTGQIDVRGAVSAEAA